MQKEVNITLEEKTTNFTSVLSGWVVHLRCQLNRSGHAVFNFNSTDILVKNSTLSGPSSRYQYNQLKRSGKVLHILTITNVAKLDEGRYICWQENSRQKQTLLKVWCVSEKEPRCTMSPSEFLFHHHSNKHPYQVNCTTIEIDLSARISLFLNDQLIPDNSTTTTRKPLGKNVEKTLSFSSFFDNVSNKIFFHCQVTHEMQSPHLYHHQNCSYNPLIISPTLETSGSLAVTTQLLQKTSNISKTPKVIEYRRKVILFVASVTCFLVIFFPSFVIGIRCIRQPLYENRNCKNKQRGNRDRELHHSPGEPMESVEPTVESRNGAVNVPPSTRDSEDFFAGMITVENDMYESSNEGTIMVKNEIYECVTDERNCQLDTEIYSLVEKC